MFYLLKHTMPPQFKALISHLIEISPHIQRANHMRIKQQVVGKFVILSSLKRHA